MIYKFIGDGVPYHRQTPPVAPSITWYDLIDLRIWGSDGIRHQTGGQMQNWSSPNTWTPLYSMAEETPANGLQLTTGPLITSIDPNMCGSFYGKGNGDFFAHTPFDKTKAWRPSKIKIEWIESEVILNIAGFGTSTMLVNSIVDLTSPAEIPIDWLDNSDFLYILFIQSKNGLPFTLTKLQAYGDDPSKYWATHNI